MGSAIVKLDVVIFWKLFSYSSIWSWLINIDSFPEKNLFFRFLVMPRLKKVQHQSQSLAQSIRLTQLVSQQLDATIITCWRVPKSKDVLVLKSVQLKPKNEWTKIADKPLRNFADCGVNFFVAEVAQTFCHCLDLS